MNTTEIVVGEVQRERGLQMRQLFAEGVGEPRKTTHLHSHSEVLPFDERSADVFRVGVPASDLGYNLDDWAWGVPFTSMLPVVSVQFNELREIRVQSKGVRNGTLVGVISIRRDLHMAGGALVQVMHKGFRVNRRSSADKVRRHKFVLRVHRHKDPLIANFGRVILSDVAGFLGDERPDFVDLQIPGAQVCHSGVHEFPTTFSGDKQEAHDRVAIQPRKSFGRANGAALKQAVNRLEGRVGVGKHRVPSQFRVGFGESRVARSAAPPLNPALTEVTSFAAFCVLASYARHLGLAFSQS
jgi:hypothetical protein